jgi:succinate dehydrogenase/fumarate reductase flavoprotein subunit
LRESYHGEPYATEYLVSEAFTHSDGAAQIPAAVLRERLARTLELVEKRERSVYRETNPEEIGAVQHSFTAFVKLCERKEQETGEPVTIIASY